MRITTAYRNQVDEITALFNATFTASEGAEEGAIVSALAKDLMTTTDAADLFVFSAQSDDALLGCILFSRLSYPQDSRTVFILSPVAVATSQQGKGIGQELLTHGLTHLRDAGVDVAITYGDPNYYSKVGFRQITQSEAQPPFPLNHPEGWLGQSLTGDAFTPLAGPSTCVPGLDNPDYW